MDAICYICDEPSTEWCQNFTKIKSKHTDTPIIVFIRQFLGDFHSVRSIDDETNCICPECLQQIDLYDWMRQQVSRQETKLRDLLLATEVNLCVKREPVEIEEDIEYCHNDDDALASNAVLQNGNEILMSTATVSAHSKEITSPVLKYPKPIVPYRCLIALALKNSRSGTLNSSEMCSFISDHFPYFETAEENWKCAIRSALSVQEPFLKTVPRTNIGLVTTKHNNLWTMKPSSIAKLDEEFHKCVSNSKMNFHSTMAMPENLPALMRGEMKHGRIYSEESMLALGAEQIQAESLSSDSQPATKRPRNDTEPTVVVPTSTFGTTSSTAPIFQSKTGLKYARPSFTHACLIALALKNSHTGSLLVAEICSFISVHFPYSRTAAENWRYRLKSVLYSDEFFVKTAIHISSGTVKTSSENIWTMKPTKIAELDEKIEKCGRIHEKYIHRIMAVPEDLPALLKGELKHGGRNMMHPDWDSSSHPAPNEPVSVQQSTAPASPTLDKRSTLNESILQLPSEAIILSPAEKISKPRQLYRHLIAMALQNSPSGLLPVNGICSFISNNFPYLKTAPRSWKSSVRRVLCKSNWFEEIPDIANKRSLWTVKPSKAAKLEIEIRKLSQSNPITKAADEVAANERDGMKLGYLDGSYIGLDDTDDPEPENEPIDSNSNDEDGFKADEIFDEIDIDDSKSFQFELNAEDI